MLGSSLWQFCYYEYTHAPSHLCSLLYIRSWVSRPPLPVPAVFCSAPWWIRLCIRSPVGRNLMFQWTYPVPWPQTPHLGWLNVPPLPLVVVCSRFVSEQPFCLFIYTWRKLDLPLSLVATNKLPNCNNFIYMHGDSHLTTGLFDLIYIVPIVIVRTPVLKFCTACFHSRLEAGWYGANMMSRIQLFLMNTSSIYCP